MKSRETKQKDLDALTESLAASKSAMVVSFTKLSVTKDQEFRNSLREAGAEYRVVKNTLARIAVKGTQFEEATESFKGVTAIAWTQNDPVILTKAISKFMKDNADIYSFKSGVVDGRLVDLKQVTAIASLPSKEELISQLLYVLNSSAQRLVTVINAVPRDLAVVVRLIGEAKPAGAPAAEAKAEEPAAAEPAQAPAAEEAAPAEAQAPAAEEAAPAEAQAPAAEATAPAEAQAPAAEEAAPAEAQAPAAAEAAPADAEAPAAEEAAAEVSTEQAADAPDDASQAAVEEAPRAETEAQAELAADAPDDKAEDVLELNPEADAERQPE